MFFQKSSTNLNITNLCLETNEENEIDTATTNTTNSNNPNLVHCIVCKLFLQRHQFQKKEFHKKNNSSPICHTCKRKATAKRCKQPPPRHMTQSRVDAESGVKRRPNNFGFCTYIDQLFSKKCFSDVVNLGVFTTAKDVSESMGSIHAASKFGRIDEEGVVLTNNSNEHNSNNSKGIQCKSSRRDDGGGVLCLCIGDGSTPRTAVLAAFLKKGWRTISIDPELKDEWIGSHDDKVKGMVGYKGTMEQFMLEPVEQHIPTTVTSQMSKKSNSSSVCDKNFVVGHLIILCVHSHVRFQNTTRIETIMTRYGSPPTTLVSIPCCPRFRHVADIGRRPDHKYDDDCIFSACRTVSIWNFGHSINTKTGCFINIH